MKSLLFAGVAYIIVVGGIYLASQFLPVKSLVNPSLFLGAILAILIYYRIEKS